MSWTLTESDTTARFVVAARDIRTWLKDVNKTHGPREIRPLLLSRMESILTMKMNVWKFLLRSEVGEMTLDELKDMFMECFAWVNRECDDLFRLFGCRTKLFRKFVDECGTPGNIAEYALMAEASGDSALAELLEEFK